MQSHLLRGLALIALIAVPSIASADAIADQKKACEAMGTRIPHPPAMCGLLTKSEGTRYLDKVIRDGELAGPVSGYAYRDGGIRGRPHHRAAMDAGSRRSE